MTALSDIQIGLTEHVEAAADAPSKRVFDATERLVRAADALGVRYAWFAEHHAHVHQGHLPTPLLYAIHLAGRTKRIALGTAVICLNHHRPIDVAEQVAVADVLSGGRMAIGFGSGSTPREATMFGAPDMDETERHARYDAALQTIEQWWSADRVCEAAPGVLPHERLPRPQSGLMQRCWSAVNSVGAASIAGRRGLNVLFSHLRTPEQYRTYVHAYREAGGTGLIAANRPLIISRDEDIAITAELAVRTLWRRFKAEGKLPADAREPQSLAEVCRHPLNFIVGSPERVAAQIAELHEQVPFDVLNVEVSWHGLPAGAAESTLERLMTDVLPLLSNARPRNARTTARQHVHT